MGFLDVLTIVFIILVLLPGIIEIAIIIFVAWRNVYRK